MFEATILEVYEQAIKDDFTFLPLQNTHLEAYKKVPLLQEHRDPFDRLLIATAHEGKFRVLTADGNFKLYAQLIEVVW